jgi:fibronectin type 3 domain-containing protein
MRRLRLASPSLRRLLILVPIGAMAVLTTTPTPAFAAGSPPPAPINMGLNGEPDSSVLVTWDSTPSATSYNIYRGTASGAEVKVASTTATSYSDAHLSPSTDYFYEITAVNSSGESPRGAEDGSETPPPIETGGNTPGVASGNSLIFYGENALLGGEAWFQKLTGWFPQILGSSGSNSPGQKVIDMAYANEGTMTFNDVVVPTAGLYTLDWRYAYAQGLFPGVMDRQMAVEVNGTIITSTARFPVTGSFDVYSDSKLQTHLNAGKNSVSLLAVTAHGVSRVDQLIVTPATASGPSGITNLAASAGSASVTLSWSASSNSPTSYNIYRGSIPDGEATTPIATVSGTTTTYTDTTAKNATTYFYLVTASNAAGSSPDSNEVYTTPGETTFSGTNLALGKDAYASSLQGAGYPATAATDGSFNSRWSSASSDPQWLLVDLGATYTIHQVVIAWESAYGKAFQIQTSNDAVNWTTIYSTTTGTGGTQNLSVSGSGRYIRMYGTVRGTGYGYSIWEFDVF